MLMLLMVVGCLERVTGEVVPLDPRFVANQPGAAGAPDGGGGGGGGGMATPFSDHEGDMVWVRGEIQAEEAMPVDLDVRVPDATAPGGVQGKGKILLEGPGPFELKVPKGLGQLELQAFQDPDTDGPSPGDPFAEVDLEIEGEDLAGVLLVLEVGARGNPADHTEAPPGEGGEHDPQPTEDGGQVFDPFADMEGPYTTISGTIECEDGVAVDLDLFQPDPSMPGGRKFLGKLKRGAGVFTIEIPASIGLVEIEAMVDVDADGPSEFDPRASYAGNPVSLTDGDVSQVDLVLVAAEEPAPVPTSSGNPLNLSLDEEFAATKDAAGGTEQEE